MWNIDFPDTPDGEKELAIYFDQRLGEYVKITVKDNVIFRYNWDGFSGAFNSVFVDYLISVAI